jgi:hypothetical protein
MLATELGSHKLLDLAEAESGTTIYDELVAPCGMMSNFARR